METLNTPVFHNEQNAAGFPYIIFTETETDFQYASGLPSMAVTTIVFTLYTGSEFDIMQSEIFKLLIDYRITVNGIKHSHNAECQAFACTFIIKLTHKLNYHSGEIDYIGSV